MGNAGGGFREIWKRNAHMTGLPKCVRPLGCVGVLDGSAMRLAGEMVEFEVVTGNAAYREGERFYLTPAQAKVAYSFERRA